jgi:hypothetical protein
MIQKTVEENKYALDSQFKPKLALATKNVAIMENKVKEEIRV